MALDIALIRKQSDVGVDGMGTGNGLESAGHQLSAAPSTITEPSSSPLTELQRILQPGGAISVTAQEFKMSRTIFSSRSSGEYDVGLGGKASVRAMYELRDQSYKKDDSERKTSQRRNIIIDELKTIADANHISPTAFALRVDSFMCTRKPVMS